MNDASPQRRAIGLISGALWLVVISAAFAALSFVMIGTPAALVSLGLTVLVVIAFIAQGIRYIRTVRRLGQLPPQTPSERRIRRWFGRIVAAEVLAIWAVNAFLGATNRAILI